MRQHLLRRLLLLALCVLLALSSVQATESDVNTGPLPNFEIETLAELKAILAKKFEERDDSHFTVTCPAGIETLVGRGGSGQMVPIVREMMAELGDASGSGADYNGLNIWAMESGILEGKLYLHPIFMTSKEEEAELDDRCRQILAELDLEGLSDYEALRAIYEYVGTHYTYDKSLTVFSAYEGLKTGSMVCQGYSILLHKLLAFQGYKNRIVTGWASTGEAHSWNIVKLGTSWYNLDVTWDACEKAGEAMGWDYFLKGEAQFSDHVRDEAFRTDKYHQKQPMSVADYPLRRTLFKSGSTHLRGVILRVGNTLPLATYVNGANEIPDLVSTDPSVVSIAADGTLTAHQVGSCSIMAYTDREDIVPGMLPVIVVDLRGASGWAYEAVTEFYLRGTLPTSLCDNFQQPLTRAEAARCLYPLLESTGLMEKVGVWTFADCFGHEDELFIARLCALGILSGHNYNTFDPDGGLTREQAAKILVGAAARLQGEPLAYDGLAPECTDAADISDWARPYVRAAMEAGLLYGMSDGSFRPQEPVTLEQFVCALERVAKSYIE